GVGVGFPREAGGGVRAASGGPRAPAPPRMRRPGADPTPHPTLCLLFLRMRIPLRIPPLTTNQGLLGSLMFWLQGTACLLLACCLRAAVYADAGTRSPPSRGGRPATALPLRQRGHRGLAS